MGKIDKEKVLSKLDFKKYYDSVISNIKWKDSGQGQSLCPFHDDHNPSLSVNSITGEFICFGCDKKGSIFDFHMVKYVYEFFGYSIKNIGDNGFYFFFIGVFAGAGDCN